MGRGQRAISPLPSFYVLQCDWRWLLSYFVYLESGGWAEKIFGPKGPVKRRKVNAQQILLCMPGEVIMYRQACISISYSNVDDDWYLIVLCFIYAILLIFLLIYFN